MFVDLGMVIKDAGTYLAHIKEENVCEMKTEGLREHTQLCQKYFRQLMAEKQIESVFERFLKGYLGEITNVAVKLFYEMLVNTITFHDIGKINPNFQIEKMKNTHFSQRREFTAVGSRHSEISAVLYMDYFKQKIDCLEKKEDRLCLKDFLLYNSYVISRHHSDLISFQKYRERLCDEGAGNIVRVFEKGEKSAYCPKFKLNLRVVTKLFRVTEENMKTKSVKEGTWLYIYERLLYSLLVASDYYATSEFMSGVEINDYGQLNNIEKFMEVYQNTGISKSIRAYEKVKYPRAKSVFNAVKEMNELRSELFLDAEKALSRERDKSLFYLEAPTGSGKSNTSMNLSFRMIEADKSLKKIYYVYPFNTLVEQNLQSLQQVFGNEEKLYQDIAVINSITPIKMIENDKKKECEEESGKYYEKALLNRQFLNYPIILTTHVSLFDTMFGDTKESVFGFYQLIGSVIVLDEIQSYKNVIWGEIITFLKEMAELLNMKIIIMSATLPNLEIVSQNMSETGILLKDREKYFSHPCFKERVKVCYDLLIDDFDEDVLYQHVKQHRNANNKILVEFIKRESAYQFFQKLKADVAITGMVAYMSGDDSILERNRILKAIKENVEEPVILVATQVIEAGVDIDMDIGYKNISKLDSEEQFMGRINRSCKKHGVVYFFKQDEPKKVYGEDVRLNPEYTLEDGAMREILAEKDFAKYYTPVLQILKRNFYDKSNVQGLDGFFKKQAGSLEFTMVKERMRLIEEKNWSMSVYLARVVPDQNSEWIDGKELWQRYRKLLENNAMSYAEKKVELSNVTSKMNGFIYQIKKNENLHYNDQIGEIFYIEEGEKYFEEGKLNRKKVQGELGDFVDFI